MVQSNSSQRPYGVTIRTNRGDEQKLQLHDSKIFRRGFSWRKVSGSSEKLTASARAEVEDKALQDFLDFAGEANGAAARDFVKECAKAEVVEVSVPYKEEMHGWGARTFPWECFLSHLTKPDRRDHSFSIVRHLKLRSSAGKWREPTSLLGVSSTPGALDRYYDFSNELRLVSRSLEFAKADLIDDPSREELSQKVRETNASVIYMAGVDPGTIIKYANHFGVAAEEVPAREDGFILKPVNDGVFDSVNATDMADLLVRGQEKPVLVTFASSFSGARMAPMTLASGAYAAVGFNGMTDDVTCGLFFPYFYAAWRAADWRVLPAFTDALSWLKEQPLANIKSGLVLWTSRSIASSEYTEDLRTGAERISSGRKDAEGTGPGAVIGLPAAEVVKVTVEPRPKLNYSLLHNAFVTREDPSSNGDMERRSPFFHRFALDRSDLRFTTPVDIEVRLNVGAGDCVCRVRKDWPENSYKMFVHDQLVLPLVANLQRQVYERLNTTIEVTVSCGGECIFQSTHLVTLLPADEWLDFEASDVLPEDRTREPGVDDHRETAIDGRPWLASFSLPRDPAVLDLVKSAQRYLRTLFDDAGSGFDGYQRVAQAPAAEIVDPQVQSFWAAILHDTPLAYINPPPSYSEHSQRIRTPSTIFETKTATCIDLALLFASVLEYIGISPVVFLVKGHAFPGFWRSEQWSNELLDVASSIAMEAPDTSTNETGLENYDDYEEDELDDYSDVNRRSSEFLEPTTSEDSFYIPERNYRWMYGIEDYPTIWEAVTDGKLVPFESTLVTRAGAFSKACEDGLENLSSMSFDCMIDINIARQMNVTPLPILLRGE